MPSQSKSAKVSLSPLSPLLLPQLPVPFPGAPTRPAQDELLITTLLLPSAAVSLALEYEKKIIKNCEEPVCSSSVQEYKWAPSIGFSLICIWISDLSIRMELALFWMQASAECVGFSGLLQWKLSVPGSDLCLCCCTHLLGRQGDWGPSPPRCWLGHSQDLEQLKTWDFQGWQRAQG